MISACSDAELLDRMADGDRRAFDELYERHAAWLHMRLARRCGDAAAVEEALQDTFLAVWRRPQGFAADGEVAAWLWGIGIRQLLNRLRRRKTPLWHLLTRSDRVVSAEDTVLLGVEAPPESWWVRALRRAGLGDRDIGLIGGVVALQGSWLAASLAVLGFVALASQLSASRLGLATFLVLAPLVPLAGVAAVFGRRADPTYELTVASPTAISRVVLLRTAAVVAMTIPAIVVLSLVLPGWSLLAFAWMLPALALSLASLALGTVVPLPRAALVLAAVWLGAAVVSFADASPGPSRSTAADTAAELVRAFAAFRPAGQLVLVGLAALSAAVLAARASELEAAE